MRFGSTLAGQFGRKVGDRGDANLALIARRRGLVDRLFHFTPRPAVGRPDRGEVRTLESRLPDVDAVQNRVPERAHGRGRGKQPAHGLNDPEFAADAAAGDDFRTPIAVGVASSDPDSAAQTRVAGKVVGQWLDERGIQSSVQEGHRIEGQHPWPAAGPADPGLSLRPARAVRDPVAGGTSRFSRAGQLCAAAKTTQARTIKPAISQTIVIRQVIANACITTDSTFFLRTMPP